VRLRRGENLLGISSAALIAVLFLDWFDSGAAGASGWSGLSIGVLILVGLAAAVATVVLILVQRGSVALSVAAAVLATVLAFAMAVAVIINVISITDGDTDARWPAVAGILFAVVMVLGAWRSMGDERLDAPDSAYAPPEPRSIPDA
jgi:predicted Na+-dependent transporter